MYEFHCNYIKIKCNASLLFTDTSSSLYETERGDVYEDKKIHVFLIMSIKKLLVKWMMNSNKK